MRKKRYLLGWLKLVINPQDYDAHKDVLREFYWVDKDFFDSDLQLFRFCANISWWLCIVVLILFYKFNKLS